MAAQVRPQVAGRGVGEEHPLRSHAARRINAHVDPVFDPLLQGERHVGVDVRGQQARVVALLPDQSLQFFQAGRLRVSIHQAQHFVAQGRQAARQVGGEGLPRIAPDLGPRLRGGQLVPVLAQVIFQVRAREGEQHLVDELDRRGRPLDVEQDAATGEGNHNLMSGSTAPPAGRCAGPKQTGVYFVCTEPST